MEINEMRRLLLQYPVMTDRLNSIRREIEEIKERKESLREVKSIQVDGMPHVNAISDSTYKKTEKIIDDFDNDINVLLNEIERIKNKQLKVGMLLRMLTPDEYRVIEARYLYGIEWDYIPAKVNMSRRNCFRVHDRAILQMINEK